jgi:8-oxo-dGTP pyrophosphatase MutT (NUDIX family)
MIPTHVVAKVLLVNPAGEVLTLRRSETAPRRPLESDIPGGWVDESEDFTAAAVRETKEETGIQLATTDLQLVYTHTARVNDHNTCWLFFIGRTQETEVKLSSEHDRAEWLTLDQAIEAITYDVQHDFLAYARDNNLL